MTLARQQQLFLAAALLLLTVLVAVLVENQRRVAQALEHLTRSQALVETVVSMRNLAVEVTTNRADRHEIQWQAGIREFARTLEELLPVTFAEEALLVRTVKQHVEDADHLFRRLLVNAPSQQARLVGSRESELISRHIAGALHVVLGDVSLMALKLSELQTAEVRAARQSVLIASTALVLAMLVILAAYFAAFRRFVLSPIGRLQEATDRVAGGDLGHRVGLTEGTEIGDLARHFDQMTEQVRVSRSRMDAANKELEAFAYSVSHDLRTPLRGMDGFSRALLEKYESHMDEDARHCLQMIRDNARQMGRLIDDLLAFSRLSQQPLMKEPVDQEALVRGVLKALVSEGKDRKIELAIGELPAAEADLRLLKLVWDNLISNALKYTRSRDPAVIRVGSERRNGVLVYFVGDNGVGFDMRYAHKLFGVFQRLHSADEYDGTGVGLAIVQRIVQRHGGRVWAEAEKNKGATFYFTLEETNDRVQSYRVRKADFLPLDGGEKSIPSPSMGRRWGRARRLGWGWKLP